MLGIGEEAERGGVVRVGARWPVAATRVRRVQLALHLRAQLGEVPVVADVRKESRVPGLQRLPVHAVHLDVEELLQRLSPDVLEHVGALEILVEVHLRGQTHRRRLLRIEIHHRQLAVVEHVRLLALGAELEVGILGVELGDELDVLLARPVLPQVVALVVLGEEVEVLSIARQRCAGEIRGAEGQPRNAVLDAIGTTPTPTATRPMSGAPTATGWRCSS